MLFGSLILLIDSSMWVSIWGLGFGLIGFFILLLGFMVIFLLLIRESVRTQDLKLGLGRKG